MAIWRKTRSLIGWLGGATLVLLLVIHWTPLTQRWAWMLADNWADATGDTLIVLASEIESDGLLGPSSYLRAMYAVRAYREGPFRTLIVSGGQSGAAPRSMGDAMREFLIANGVPANAIRVESRAMSTRENALFIKPLLTGLLGKPVLMTSDFHMFRARRVFEKAGIPVLTRPIPDVLKRSKHIVNRWSSFWTLVTETGKIGFYGWRGWI